MPLALSALSTVYVKVPVVATKNGATVSPTTDVVSLAFPASGVVPTTWYVGTWETAGSTYLARVLIGPGGGAVTLTAGSFDIWVKVADNPETPVAPVDTLTIY